MLNVACIQLCAGTDVQANLSAAIALIRQAAAKGAKFIITPENTCCVTGRVMQCSENDPPRPANAAKTPCQDDHPMISKLADLAGELGVWIVAGSIKVSLANDTNGDHHGRMRNRSFLFAPSGKIAATYDKIHLYDADLPDGTGPRESHYIAPGDNAMVVDIPSINAVIGMSICYDIRFGHLYRDMAKAGANILLAPAAFFVYPGQLHWEVMLRARAIETGSFVLAAAQTGDHCDDQGHVIRQSYGHSMIIDPWGRILAHQDDNQPGFIMATLDLSLVDQARNAIQQLSHDRPYHLQKIRV